jgi:hypothetical protein
MRLGRQPGDRCHVGPLRQADEGNSIRPGVLRLIFSMVMAPLFPPAVEIDLRQPGFRIVGQASTVNSASRASHLE